MRIVVKGVIFLALSVVLPITVQAQDRDNTTCGIVPGQQLTNPYGPWDFTNPAHADKLPIVLRAHFTPQVERLVKGQSGYLLGDIDYTLRAIPNYHRALVSISTYERLRSNREQGRKQYYTAECYFRRAIYFQPKDVTTQMLFGMHLHLTKQYQAAEKIYLSAIAINPNYAELQYNTGLLYVDMKKLNNAIEHAKIAYDLGFPLKGLENKIKRLGGSVDP